MTPARHALADATPLGLLGTDGESGSPASFHAFLRPIRWRLALAAALGGLTQLCAIGLLATAAWLISRAAQMPPLLTLSVAIVAVRAFGIGRGVLRYAERLLAHDTVLAVLGRVRARVFEALASQSPEQQHALRRSDALVVLVRDVDELQYLPLRVYLPTASALVASVACVIVQWSIDSAAGVVLAAFVAASAALSWWAARAVPEADPQVGHAQAQVAAAVHDSMVGAADIAALGVAGRAVQQLASAQSSLERTARRSQWAANAGASATVVLQGAVIVLLAARLVPLMQAGRLAPVWLATALLLPLALAESLGGITTAAVQWRSLRAALLRVDAILGGSAAPPAQVVVEGIAGAGSGAEPSFTAPQHQRAGSDAHIELKFAAVEPAPAVALSDASARWPGADVDALSEVRLALPERGTLVVTGNSGSGKSTLVSVLARLLALRSGTYQVHGADATVMPDERFRGDIAAAEQEAYVFAASLAENIRLASPAGARADDEQVWSVLERVGLAEWARCLPRGTDTQLGAGGVWPSGGQRQRIAIARVLLREAGVWVLDEPTEYLDQAAAEKVMRAVRVAATDRLAALLLVTHQPEVVDIGPRSDDTWRPAPLVLTLRHGAVVAASVECESPGR